jgi:hypothetical protein
MADRMACEIWIGGTLSPALAEELCAVVRDTGASLEWGGGAFAPDNIAELLRANDDGHLHLYDDERSWGEFEDLEEFLREHKIPYDRQTASKYEYDAEKAVYRPGTGLEVVPTNGAGNPVVEIVALQPVAKSFGVLCEHAKSAKSDKVSVLRRAERMQRLLLSKLPREMPPLQPLTIKDGQYQSVEQLVEKLRGQTHHAP